MFALQFPGQGAQSEGFLHRLPDHPAVRATFAEARDALELDAATFDALDTRASLESTIAVQVSLTIAGVAFARALADEGFTPDLCAGLSVGAYAAAVCCDAVDFDVALRMVRTRAELMERAYPHGYGLSAILGLTEHEIDTLALAFEQDAGERVYVGNVNAPRQIVVSGKVTALDAFNERALAAGARKASRLAVSVPSHCELLAHAADSLIAYASELPFRAPQRAYIGNRGARPLRTADAIREDLATNLRYTVRWFDALTVMVEMGATALVEAPPDQLLTGIAREHFPSVAALSGHAMSLDRLVATLERRLGGA